MLRRRGSADDVCLTFDHLLRCRRELAHIHLGEVTEGGERLPGLTTPGAVNLTGIAADTLSSVSTAMTTSSGAERERRLRREVVAGLPERVLGAAPSLPRGCFGTP
jgi:hypothetical protein